MRTTPLFALGLLLVTGCSASSDPASKPGSGTDDIETRKTLAMAGGWTTASMPDGTSVEDYAVAHQIPDLYSATITVVSRPTKMNQETWRSDLSIATSRDFGATFAKIGSIHDAPVNAHVFVAPSDENVVYVTAGGLSTGMGPADAPGMLWKSTDAGAHFTKSAASNTPTRLDIDPNDPSHLVGATCDGVYRSMDGGATFAKIANSPNVQSCNGADLYRSAKNRDVMYVLYSVGEGGGGELRASFNGAGTWSTVASGEIMRGFAIHPNDAMHVYVFDGARGWLSSADGGKTLNPHNSSLKLDDGSGGGMYSAPISNVAFDTFTGKDPALYLVNDGKTKRWAPGAGPEGGVFVDALAKAPGQLDELRFETLYESLKDGTPSPALIGILGTKYENAPRKLAIASLTISP